MALAGGRALLVRMVAVGVVPIAMLAEMRPAVGQVVVQPGTDLHEAIVAARGQPQPRVVELAAGRHTLARPLVLAEADSSLTLRGPAVGEATIVGSVPLDGWAPVTGRPGVFEARLPGDLRTSPPRHLFRDGRMLTRARTPNTGWLESPGILAVVPPFTLTLPDGQSVADWKTSDAIWIVGLQKWAGFTPPVRGIDAADNAVRLDGRLFTDRQEKVNRFWIENAPAALDADGEWRFDPERGTIQLFSSTGRPPAVGTVTAPVLAELVRLQDCRDVTITRLRLCEADDDCPAAGEVDIQAAIARRGAVRMRGARDVMIRECVFDGLGGYAVDIGRGSQGCRVDQCVFARLGAGGVRIGESTPEDAPAAAVTEHVVEACDVHEYGRTYFGAAGLIVLQASHVRLARNEVHHGNYTAISVGWTWGYQDSPCHHNLVEANVIHHVGNDLLSDMGGVYLLGPQPGTIVRRNRIHDVFCHHYGGWGLYTDEGSSGMLLEDNIVWNCKSAGFHQHYGRDNVLRNNLIVDCGEGGLLRTRDEPHRSFTFEHNVVVCREPRFVSGTWSQGDTVLRGNLYFSPAGAAPSWNGRTLADWQSAGHDAGSRYADPKLVDPSRPDLGPAADSPAVGMGIRIPVLGIVDPEK